MLKEMLSGVAGSLSRLIGSAESGATSVDESATVATVALERFTAKVNGLSDSLDAGLEAFTGPVEFEMTDDESEYDLEKMSTDDLRALAKEYKISGYARMARGKLIAALAD